MKAITITLNVILLLGIVVVASILVYSVVSSILSATSTSSGYHLEYNVMGSVEDTGSTAAINIVLDIRCIGDCGGAYISEVEVKPVDRYSGLTITSLSKQLYFPLINNTAHIELTMYIPGTQNASNFTDLLINFRFCKEYACDLYYAVVQVK